MSDISDEELIEQFKKGDMSAFEQIVLRYQTPLVNYFYFMTQDKDLSEDCAQEVFLKLYPALKQYRPKAKFITFLFKIAKNLWIDLMRAQKLHSRHISLDATGENGESLSEKIENKQQDPLTITANTQLHEKLHQAIAQLPEHLKEVLILSEFEGLKYEEISRILKIPVGTVKSRMFTAMSKLRNLLKGEKDELRQN